MNIIRMYRRQAKGTDDSFQFVLAKGEVTKKYDSTGLTKIQCDFLSEFTAIPNIKARNKNPSFYHNCKILFLPTTISVDENADMLEGKLREFELCQNDYEIIIIQNIGLVVLITSSEKDLELLIGTDPGLDTKNMTLVHYQHNLKRPTQIYFNTDALLVKASK